MTNKEAEYLESLKNDTNTPSNEGVLEKLSKEEREIVLIFNEAEGVWQAETSIPKFWRKLENKNWTCTSTQYYKDGTVCSKTFVGSKKGVSITDPFRVREVSEENRQKARERFLKLKSGESENETE